MTRAIPTAKLEKAFPRLFKNEFASRQLLWAFSSGGFTYARLLNLITGKEERAEMWYRWVPLKGWEASYSLKG